MLDCLDGKMVSIADDDDVGHNSLWQTIYGIGFKDHLSGSCCYSGFTKSTGASKNPHWTTFHRTFGTLEKILIDVYAARRIIWILAIFASSGYPYPVKSGDF